MLKFTNNSDTPHGGYRFHVAETGQDFQSFVRQQLKEAVVAHLKGNNLTVPADLDAQIEDFTCRYQGGNFCDETDPRYGWLSGAILKFRVVLAGTEILGKWLLAGKPFVAQELADERSEVCASCLYNRDPQGCATCQWSVLYSTVLKFLGSKRSSRRNALKSCASCGCALQLKVWIPHGHLKSSFAYADLPAWCWVAKETYG